MTIINGCQVPENLYYAKDHAWLKVEGSLGKVGLSDFAQKLAGEISFVKLPRIGRSFTAGQNFIALESGKWTGRIAAPVSGKVVEVNAQLNLEPGLINKDPYGEGWIAVLELADPGKELDLLMFGGVVHDWLSEEMKRIDK